MLCAECGYPRSRLAQLEYGPIYFEWRTTLPAGRLRNSPVTWLSATERRRVGKMVRLALTVGRTAVQAAYVDAGKLATVFTSSSGDGDNCDAIFTTLAATEKSERFISPTRFHNSVHNAAAGYWSIANQCMMPSTSLCAYNASFAAGLMEACCQAMWTGEKFY